MNFFNKLFLKLALLPSAVYSRMGIDVYHLTSILVMKLTMDDRRTSALNLNKQKKKGPVNKATLFTMLMSFLFGIFLMLSFMEGNNSLTHFTFFFSFFMFMLAGLLIADFTSVLIDVRDNQILLPKPISEKTFIMARLLHIFVHVCKIVVPMTFPSVVLVAFVVDPWKVPAMIIAIMFATLFCIFIINAFYLLILKITTPSKFQGIISYFQVVFAIAIYGGYQLIPRLMRNDKVENLNLEKVDWVLSLPPYWFGAFIEACTLNISSLHGYTAAVLALVLPPASIYLVVKYFAPAFTRKVALITAVDAPQKKVSISGKKVAGGWWRFWANLLTNKKAERMGFHFTNKMTGRSRDFRLKVYPSIGYIAVFIALTIYQSNGLDLSALKSTALGGKVMVISMLYLTAFLVIVAINQILYSEKYKAAWVFFTTPIEKPGFVISGAAKSAIVKFYLPFALVIAVAGVLFIGISFIPTLFLGLANVLLSAYIVVRLGVRQLPFSKQEEVARGGGRWMKQMAIMILPFGLAFLHFLVYNIMPVVIILGILSLGATWLLASGIKGITWQQVRPEYED